LNVLGASKLLLSAAYLVAGVLFILALRGLSSQETAQRGNIYGIAGMLIAIAATVSFTADFTHPLVIAAMDAATVIGATMALHVGMTAMPEMVARLHSFVGRAAVLVGLALQLDALRRPGLVERIEVFIDVWIGEVFIDVWIGAITTTGSVIAFLKLRGTVSGKPLLLPARHFLNLAMLVSSVVLNRSIFNVIFGGFGAGVNERARLGGVVRACRPRTRRLGLRGLRVRRSGTQPDRHQR
jgi:H+-translocating NAD(P) transhydrogenase subunit beta